MPVEPAFLRARQEYDDRYSDLARGKRNWQIAALILGLSNIILVAGLVLVALRSHVVPYIVKENELGELAAWGSAEELQELSRRHYIAELGRFIRSARSISSDAAAQKLWVDQAYAFATQGAARVLNEYYRDHNPYELSEKEAVTVTVRSVVPVSEGTWQIRWVEERRDLAGRELSTAPWSGIVSTKLIPPKKVETILLNPSGLYITSLHWTPELGERE